jgi:hypothetical protein
MSDNKIEKAKELIDELNELELEDHELDSITGGKGCITIGSILADGSKGGCTKLGSISTDGL